MKIHESAENYLEAILMIREEKGTCRSIDVVHRLGFSKPSVSVAMANLRKSGYVLMDEDGLLDLTEKGREVAERMYERHVVITSWLRSMGVPEDVAAEDACRIEHDLSDVTFEKMKEKIQREQTCPVNHCCLCAQPSDN